MPRKTAVTLVVMAVLLLVGAVPTYAAINAQFYGSLYSELKLTPEDGLIGGTQLQLAGLAASPDSKASAKFDLIWQSTTLDNPFWGQSNPQKFQFVMNSATLTLQGPWLPGGKPVTTALGDAPVNYSPWAAKLDGANAWDLNAHKKGISVSGIQVGSNGLIDGFLVWDGGQFSRTLGARLGETFGGTSVTGVAVDYESSAGLYQPSSAKDQVVGLEAKGQAGDRLNWQGLAYYQRKTETPSGTATESVIQGIGAKGEVTFAILPSLTVRLGARSFGKDFAPRYRDLDPDGVVAASMDQRGLTVEVTSSWRGIDFSTSYDLAQKDSSRSTITDTAKVGASTTLGGFGVGASLTDTRLRTEVRSVTQGKLEISRNIQVNDGLSALGSYTLSADDSFGITTTNSVSLKATLQKGPLSGLTGFIGWDGARNNIGTTATPASKFSAGLDYAFANGLALKARWATPNNANDEAGKEDNIFQLSGSVSF